MVHGHAGVHVGSSVDVRAYIQVGSCSDLHCVNCCVTVWMESRGTRTFTLASRCLPVLQAWVFDTEVMVNDTRSGSSMHASAGERWVGGTRRSAR